MAGSPVSATPRLGREFMIPSLKGLPEIILVLCPIMEGFQPGVVWTLRDAMVFPPFDFPVFLLPSQHFFGGEGFRLSRMIQLSNFSKVIIPLIHSV